jgi:hypothetical protein
VLDCWSWSFHVVILVLQLTQIWTEFLSGGIMLEFAFIIQKMPWIDVRFGMPSLKKENEFLSLLCLCYGMNKQFTCPVLLAFNVKRSHFCVLQVQN